MQLVSYLKNTISELKLVRWPTRSETVRLTGMVIGISVFVGLFIGLLDYTFTNLLTIIVK